MRPFSAETLLPPLARACAIGLVGTAALCDALGLPVFGVDSAPPRPPHPPSSTEPDSTTNSHSPKKQTRRPVQAAGQARRELPVVQAR